MPGYSAERYRQNPPAIGCVLKYYSKEDTDSIVEVFKRVGRTHFSYPDVSDLLPNYIQPNQENPRVSTRTGSQSIL